MENTTELIVIQDDSVVALSVLFAAAIIIVNFLTFGLIACTPMIQENVSFVIASLSFADGLIGVSLMIYCLYYPVHGDLGLEDCSFPEILLHSVLSYFAVNTSQ